MIKKIWSHIKSVPFIYYWVPVIAICSIIFYLSGKSKLPSMPVHIPQIDKVIHMIFYASIGFFFRRAAENTKGIRAFYLYPGMAAVLFCTFYGFTDEWHQYYVPNRSVSFFDWMADILGGYLGQYIYAKSWFNQFFSKII
jgi:VanZ family protein